MYIIFLFKFTPQLCKGKKSQHCFTWGQSLSPYMYCRFELIKCKVGKFYLQQGEKIKFLLPGDWEPFQDSDPNQHLVTMLQFSLKRKNA